MPDTPLRFSAILLMAAGLAGAALAQSSGTVPDVSPPGATAPAAPPGPAACPVATGTPTAGPRPPAAAASGAAPLDTKGR